MPGVLLIECGAQTAGALWASLQPDDTPLRFMLAQVLQFKILHPVLPGETVNTAVVVEKVFGTLVQFEVTLTIDRIEVARGRLVLSTG